MINTNMIIKPSREKGEPVLPAAGLFLINPSEAEAGLRLAEKRNCRRYFLFNSNLMLITDPSAPYSFFMAGPAVGAPMAVLTLEKLIALGASSIIVYGWCGSLSSRLAIGDIVLPTWAVSDEGTSNHYPLDHRPESHAPTRQLLKDGLEILGQAVHSGPVWSTDAPYRESLAQVKQLGNAGVLGVDMEYSALVAAAAYRKVDLSAVFLVSDELWSGTWNPGFRTKGFKKKSSNILQFLMDFCAERPGSV
jgi:purine-nucleoside phosphorylase